MEDRADILRDMSICRFCLDDIGPFTSIHDKDSRDGNQTVPLPLQIMACVAIEVFSNDGMPQLICYPCRAQTIGAYIFKTTCKKADDALKLFLATGNQKLIKPLQKNKTGFKSDNASKQSAAKRQRHSTDTQISSVKKTHLTSSTITKQQSQLIRATGTLNLKQPQQQQQRFTIVNEQRKPPPLQSQPSQSQEQYKHRNIAQDEEEEGEGEPQVDPLGDDLIHHEDQDEDQMVEEGEDMEHRGLNSSLEDGEVTQQQVEEIYGVYGDEEDERGDSEEGEEEKVMAQSLIPQVPTDVFPCDQCERSFPLQQLLDIHRKNHTRVRSFPCGEAPHCHRRFFTKYDLAKHMQTHTEQRPFSCTVCGKQFAREALLHRHEKVHVDVPKYLCTQCDKTFVNKGDYDAHAEKHKKKRPFTCRLCMKSFVFKQGLERHELTHSDEKPHKCNYCEASFTSPIKLMRHITSHAGLRPYPCKLCGRTFLLSHHLTRHMRSHYAAKSNGGVADSVGQHKCDVCSMSFRRKDSLINHSAIHSMVNLRCVICNTNFINAKQVKEHITSHLTGLPYPCDKCDYSFDTQDQLEEHELKHAEMEYEEQIEQEVSEEHAEQYRAQIQRRTGEVFVDDEGVEEEEEGVGEDEEEGSVAEFTITDSEMMQIQRKPRSDHPPKTHYNYINLNDPNNMSHTQLRQSNITIHHHHMDEQQLHHHNLAEEDPAGDLLDMEDTKHTIAEQIRELEERAAVVAQQEQQSGIKPIVRTEGTKMYARKANRVVKGRQDQQGSSGREEEEMAARARLPPLAQINHQDSVFTTSKLKTLGLTVQEVNSMPTKKFVNMKVGDKTLCVQKLIMSKAEVEAMAREGKCEMNRSGNIILKKQLPQRSTENSAKLASGQISSVVASAKTSLGHIPPRAGMKKTYVKRVTSSPRKPLPPPPSAAAVVTQQQLLLSSSSSQQREQHHGGLSDETGSGSVMAELAVGEGFFEGGESEAIPIEGVSETVVETIDLHTG